MPPPVWIVGRLSESRLRMPDSESLSLPRYLDVIRRQYRKKAVHADIRTKHITKACALRVPAIVREHLVSLDDITPFASGRTWVMTSSGEFGYQSTHSCQSIVRESTPFAERLTTQLPRPLGSGEPVMVESSLTRNASALRTRRSTPCSAFGLGVK